MTTIASILSALDERTIARQIGIPQDLAAALLKAWSMKNHPPGKQIITSPEVDEQVGAAYAKGYRSCGCEEPGIKTYCAPSCPLFKHRDGSVRSGEAPAAMDKPAQSSENTPVSKPEKHAQPAVLSAAMDRQAECGSDRVDHQSGDRPQSSKAKERSCATDLT